jgi:hypothetical protein
MKDCMHISVTASDIDPNPLLLQQKVKFSHLLIFFINFDWRFYRKLAGLTIAVRSTGYQVKQREVLCRKHAKESIVSVYVLN